MLADIGASDAYQVERRQLKETGHFTYTTDGLFSDKNKDALKQLNNTYQVTDRAIGAGQAVLGAMGVAAAITSAPATTGATLGLGAAANLALGTMSADAVYTGAKQLVSGQSEATLTNQALQGLGLSPEAASYAELALGVGAAVKASSVIVKGAQIGAKAESTVTYTVNSLPGKAIGQFDMVTNPGPLANMPGTPAANFSGGKYTAITLAEDITLYRGGDSSGKALGQWFTVEPPKSIAQVRIDTAVKPQWIDPVTGKLVAKSPIDAVYTIKIPSGTTIYQGPVGNQGGIYVGGNSIDQIFIREPWKIPGVEEIGQPKNLK